MGWNIIALPEYFWNNFHPPNQQTGQEAVQVYRFSKPCFYLSLSERKLTHGTQLTQDAQCAKSTKNTLNDSVLKQSSTYTWLWPIVHDYIDWVSIIVLICFAFFWGVGGGGAEECLNFVRTLVYEWHSDIA